jgi:hypothetical protein
MRSSGVLGDGDVVDAVGIEDGREPGREFCRPRLADQADDLWLGQVGEHVPAGCGLVRMPASESGGAVGDQISLTRVIVGPAGVSTATCPGSPANVRCSRSIWSGRAVARRVIWAS